MNDPASHLTPCEGTTPPVPLTGGHPVKEVVIDARGVDRTLIRWMLTLTPLERLRHAEAAAALLEPMVSPGFVPGAGSHD